MPSSSDTTTTTDELQRAWQAFCRTTEFQHAAKWVADDDFPGALFVAFRAGAACTAAAATPAAEQAEPVAVPAGYVLVPVEATEAMLSAIDMTHSCAPIDQWRAAIAAAPPAPARQPSPALTVGMLMEVGLMVGSTPDSVGTSNWAVRMLGALRALAVDQPDAPPAPARQEPLADLPPNEKLLALADRIDHEKLWSRAGLERPDWTQEQHDRCDAGVHLRRYAALLGQDWWRIYPPRGSNSFCSETLDGAVRLARKHERMFPAAPITAAPAEGGA